MFHPVRRSHLLEHFKIDLSFNIKLIMNYLENVLRIGAVSATTIGMIRLGYYGYKDFTKCKKYKNYTDKNTQFIDKFKDKVTITKLCENNKESISKWIETNHDNWWKEYYNKKLLIRNIKGFVTKIDNSFSGIILYEIKEDHIYIHLLLSENNYRTKRAPIGSLLLSKLELHSYGINKLKLNSLHESYDFYIKKNFTIIDPDDDPYYMDKLLVEEGFFQKQYNYFG